MNITMEGEEKTCAENGQLNPAAETATAEVSTAASAGGNPGFGKFKNAAELQSAYLALEKEFTRKCQELSELRKQSRSTPQAQAAETDTRDNADTKEIIQNPADTANANTSTDTGAYMSAGAADKAFKPIEKESLTDGYDSKRQAKTRTTEPDNVRLIDRKVPLAEVLNDAKVREAVIRQYLKSLRNTSARLIGGTENAAYVITPPKRPKTIKEAGAIAEKIFK